MWDDIHRAEECAMASWMEERDRLVEQTRIFVAGIAAAAPARPIAAPSPAPEPRPAAAAVVAELAPSPAIAENPVGPLAMPPRLKCAPVAVSARAEIKQRVSAFQAHQTRLIREREAFYEATKLKIRNQLRSEPKSQP
jgi:hypothetical protein